MKSKNLRNFASMLLISMMVLATAACKKDKDDDDKCVPPALATQIVGNWQATVLIANYPVTFTQNGELTGDLAAAIKSFPGLQGIDEVIKYEVKSDTQIDLKASMGGQPLAAIPLMVSERECDKMRLSADIGGSVYQIVITRQQ